MSEWEAQTAWRVLAEIGDILLKVTEKLNDHNNDLFDEELDRIKELEDIL